MVLIRSTRRWGNSLLLTSTTHLSNQLKPPVMIITRSPISYEIIHTVPAFIQSCVVWWHTSTGLPWWATFASATVMTRSALFPLVIHQRQSADKMAGTLFYLLNLII